MAIYLEIYTSRAGANNANNAHVPPVTNFSLEHIFRNKSNNRRLRSISLTTNPTFRRVHNLVSLFICLPSENGAFLRPENPPEDNGTGAQKMVLSRSKPDV
ncbi:Hypothetical protein CINCED_3A017483 [Cinara cedri]|uniref:Uncharacterized protein n=1 Tax=Cinara cedri TaxID=506608 RepID=A0A5E4NH27_9HEMI|nr:Hypothetical protein CINCED_3A017483 [Cinara cedri]